MSPLERAARALVANMAATGVSVTITLDADNMRRVDINGCFDMEAAVRAVVAAIREPSAAMVEGLPLPSMRAMPDHYRLAYRAMLDALLGETTDDQS